MPTLLNAYQRFCAEGRFAASRQKDILTALKYLAATYETTLDRLPLTPEVLTSYRTRLHDFLTAAGKSDATIRNSMQNVGQFLKAAHQAGVTPTPPLPPKPTATMYVRDAHRLMHATSPYKHLGQLNALRYRLPESQWPADVVQAFDTFRARRKDTLRPQTFISHRMNLCSLLGYLSLSGPARLACIPPDALAKLGLDRYRDDRQEIVTTPIHASWEACFDVRNLRSFITWHAWRTHAPLDAKVRERPPSKPTQLGSGLVSSVLAWAVAFAREDYATIHQLWRSLSRPRKIHNKSAEYHTFNFAELEGIALALIDEARHMRPRQRHWTRACRYPGMKVAFRFQAGLILMLGWRIPMRARNWCECLLETNLRQVHGVWHVHFEGAELKIGTRRGETNIYDMEVPAECVPYLEEYLEHWRPLLPDAANERHVFLSMSPQHPPLREKLLTIRLQAHVFRLTGGKKRFFTHLLRTIFVSNMMSAGVDVNSVAYGVNDATQTVISSYNELYAQEHRRTLQDAYRRQLHRNGT